MRRGEVWWTDFGQPFGSEPGYRRPALILQSDFFNKSAISTLVVVPLSSSLDLAGAPGNVVFRPRDTGLRKPSIANVSRLTVVDRRRCVEKAGAVPGALLRQIEDGVRLVLAL